MTADRIITHFETETRAEWRELRKADVTASRIGVLVGEHPFVTPLQLWAEKTGRLPEENLDSPAKKRGRLLEPVGVQMVAEELPAAQLRPNTGEGVHYWRDGPNRIGATPDLLVEDSERGLGVVQLKNIEPSLYRKTWADEAPMWVALQALTEAQLVGAKWAAVGALRVGWVVDFTLIDVPLHAGAWQRLVDEVGAFWHSVETDTPPKPDFERDAKTIAALNAHGDGGSIDLSDDREFIIALKQRERIKKLIGGYETQCARLDTMIRHRIGPNETALAGDWRVSAKTQTIAAHQVKEYTKRPLRVTRRIKIAAA